MDRFTQPYFLFSFFSSFLLFSFSFAAFDLATIPFHDGFTYLWGKENVIPSLDGNTVKLIIHEHSGKLN
ncbi:hypothetical protein MtrunA17_Chr8g0382031 [Medicago truncatula]|uniref:Transmembrane protein n=1 Tax=Medicago truncatula TaxID=3880 RepID=A0A396GQV4_MEDTR|nr:hypothetical protein MtrunA17_Chr8g0382031 [Medicago truncatula]